MVFIKLKINQKVKDRRLKAFRSSEPFQERGEKSNKVQSSQETSLVAVVGRLGLDGGLRAARNQ
jgi:hypothetical protein